jgi:hypothetical protein
MNDMDTMSKLHLTDDGWVDPYSRSVKDLLNLLLDRFPSHEDWFDSCAKLLVLGKSSDDLYYEAVELVQLDLCSIMERLPSSSVPQRDLALAQTLFDVTAQRALLLYGPSLQVQKSLEEAYLDAIGDERATMIHLAELRDHVFETSAKPQVIDAFLYHLQELLHERKQRGWPSWRGLEDCCKELEFACEMMVRS